MFKLNELKSEAKRVIVGFPLVIVSAVLGIAVWNFAIETGIYDYPIVVLIYGLFLGIPIHYAAVIAIESNSSIRFRPWLFLALGVVIHVLIITHLLLSKDFRDFESMLQSVKTDMAGLLGTVQTKLHSLRKGSVNE